MRSQWPDNDTGCWGSQGDWLAKDVDTNYTGLWPIWVDSMVEGKTYTDREYYDIANRGDVNKAREMAKQMCRVIEKGAGPKPFNHFWSWLKTKGKALALALRHTTADTVCMISNLEPRHQEECRGDCKGG